MEYVILVILGLIAGAIGSLIGLGGGIIIVPALLFLGDFTSLLPEVSPQIAVGTSLLVVIFTGLSSTLSYMKHKTVDYKSALIFFIGSGPAAILGAFVNKFLDLETFSIYFGAFVIFVSVVLMLNGKLKPVKKRTSGVIRSYVDENGDEKFYGFNPYIGIVISFFVGFCSGLFGIGGGSLMVPVMILLFGFPAHRAVATSMLIIFLSAIVSSITNVTLGHINWLFALALVPGAWFGGKLGAFLNKKLSSNALVFMMRIILLIIGIRLIYQGL